MEEIKQAVTETNAETPSVEEEGAQDNLETLLQDYEEEVKGEEKETDSDISSVVKYIEEERQRKEQETVQADIKTAVDTVKENLEGDLPDWMIEGALQHKAANDARIRNAWVKRGENPKGWNSVLKALAKDISSELTDKQSTETRNEVVAAVKGASQKTTEPEVPDLGKMSDQDFEMWKRGLK